MPLTSLIETKLQAETYPEKATLKNPCASLASQHLVQALVQLSVTIHHPQLKKQQSTLQAFQDNLVQLLLASKQVLESLEVNSEGCFSTIKRMAHLMQEANTLGNGVWALNPIQPPKQIHEFLDAVYPLAYLHSNTQHARVVVHPALVPHSGLQEYLLTEQLNPGHYGQLTQWFEALQQTLHSHTTHVLASYSATLPQDVTGLVPHLLGIRIFGSAYYLYMVKELLLNEAFSPLIPQEPLLFHALHYYDTLPSQGLLVHQNFVGLHPVSQEPDCSIIDPLLKHIELHTEGCKTANAKELTNAMALQVKFRKGILPCTLQQHDTAELWEKMNTLGLTQESVETTDYNALHEQQAIYQLLPHINETPVTEREIMLAAWLYRFDSADETYQQSLTALASVTTDKPELQHWNTFCNYHHASELRTIKALETSHLHRMLHVPSASLPLGVGCDDASRSRMV